MSRPPAPAALINAVLTIAGRRFTVGTTADEEPHVQALAALVDDRARRLPGAAALNDAQLLLFTALWLADEWQEARTPPAIIPPAFAQRVVTLAERLEALADSLEQ